MSYSFLDGIRVLDLSQYVPGPYATLLLADMGAEVVRIEPPGGEPMRRFGPPDGDGISAWYKVVNGSKSV
ncbi:MAG: CoA transferase, partial [Rhodospirillaceae bacterium]|nr:CoA transferase [Rhodospirillaceae bacterium]